MIKYFCDTCENEVFDKHDLFEMNIPYMHENSAYAMVLHICEDCVIKINDYVIHGIKNKPCDTPVSDK